MKSLINKFEELKLEHELPNKNEGQYNVGFVKAMNISINALNKFVDNNNNLDYSLKNGEIIWFTYKIKPKDKNDWIEAEILNLNWAYKSAAIKIKGYKGICCHGISALSRERYYY